MKRCSLLALIVSVVIGGSLGTLSAAVTNSPLPLPKAALEPAKTTEAVITPPVAAVTTTSAPVSTAPTVGNPDMVCPVLTDEKAELKYNSVFEGKIYYLCCARCVNKFNENPKLYIAALENKENSGTVYTAAPPSESAVTPSTATSADRAVAAQPETSLTIEERLIDFLGSLHPIFLHFPIALLIAAALAECWYGFSGRHSYAPISIFCVRLGAMIAVVTALSGWAAAWDDAGTSPTAWVLTWHRWLGTGTAVGAVGAALFSIGLTVESERSIYRWVIYAVALAVAVTGHFGGMLVYGVNSIKWPF